MASFPEDITKLFRNFRTTQTIVKAKLLFFELQCVFNFVGMDANETH